MRFRLATWNMNHWQTKPENRPRAWDFLEKEVQPDVALLQETMPPKGIQSVHRKGGIDQSRPWGSAVVSFGPKLTPLSRIKTSPRSHEHDLLQTVPGSVAIAEVAFEGSDPLTVASLYGSIERGYALTTVHRILSDLTPLFDSPRKKRVILGGDLNCSTQLEPPHRQRHANLFARFQSLGLVDLLNKTREKRKSPQHCSCDEAPNCGHVQTHRHPRSGEPWQDDYLFATKPLADRLLDCFVIDSAEPDPWSLSDHCPVVANFDL